MTDNLNSRDWKEFYLSSIFSEIKRGRRLTKNKQVAGSTPYISSTMLSNGIDGFIGNIENVRKFSKCLTIANSGSVGSVFYHDYEFIASDHVTILKNKNLSKNQYLFLATCLRDLGEKYSFNREISDRRIKRERIMLPINEAGEPDWIFMGNFVNTKSADKQLTFPKKKLHTITDYRELNQIEWQDFSIEDFATVKSGADWPAKTRAKGYNPFVGSSSLNNGVTDFVNFSGKEAKVDCGVISINRNGSVGYSFYHPYPAYFSGDTRYVKVSGYQENIYVNLFITTMIRAQKEKYSYGYKMGTGRIRRQKIMLPINEVNKPAWCFMEQYMKRKENELILSSKI